MHLKCCICFTETEKKNPFSSSIVFAQSLTCVFFSLSGKSQDSPNTAQGAEKCFLEGKNKVLLMLISFPSKNLKEGEVRTKKKFFSLLFLSRFQLSLGRGWSACLTAEWALGSCRCWTRLRKGRKRRPGTERCWTWTRMGRSWRWKEMDRTCG